MSTYILNTPAKTSFATNHLWDMPMGQWLSRELMSRVSVDNPQLEYRIASELAQNNSFEATDQEIQYIRTIIIGLEKDSMGVSIDNLFKSQVLACLT